jgi:hypothetical protein
LDLRIAALEQQLDAGDNSRPFIANNWRVRMSDVLKVAGE